MPRSSSHDHEVLAEIADDVLLVLGEAPVTSIASKGEAEAGTLKRERVDIAISNQPPPRA
jgi:hypothetical protein